jgi:hypothetical protein
MVDIEVGKSLLEMLRSQSFWLKRRHYKLRKVNFSRAVSIDHPNQKFDSFLTDVLLSK